MKNPKTKGIKNIIEIVKIIFLKFKVILYEGEIVEYRVSPMTATSDLNAAQNRLSISVNVSFQNFKKEDDSFERRFSFYFDFPAEQQLISIKSEAHEIIFERITQDIFNASLAKW